MLLQGLIDASQASVNGKVRLKLYKGTIMCVGRESATDSLFDPMISTFDDGGGGAYNQADAAGFIKLNALRLRIAAKAKRAAKPRAPAKAASKAANKPRSKPVSKTAAKAVSTKTAPAKRGKSAAEPH